MDRIQDGFLARAHEQPDATAFLFGDSCITYADLKDVAARIASTLSEPSKRHAPVAIHATKTPRTVGCMLGCLMAGIPYVLVDPGIPAARRTLILSDCGASLILFDDSSGGPPLFGPTDEDEMEIAEISSIMDGCRPRRRDDASLAIDDVAYILYTSGSTGKPKGVAASHTNAVTFMCWAQELVGVRPADVVACFAPLHFDMHIFDLFGSLAAGASVLLVEDRATVFPEAVCGSLQQANASVLYAVPSAWINLLHSEAFHLGGLPSLRKLMYSGEEFPVGYLRQLARAVPSADIFNIYGPVETNAITALEVTEAHLAAERVPIGLPFGGSDVFLVDEENRVISDVDVEGEIVVSSPTVSPGYVNDAVLTAASRAHIDAGGTRYEVFRTGDFGLRDASGLLHFRGRRDGRVKSRGFRIELGEVEARIMTHPKVGDAAVVTRPHRDWTCELVAFASPELGATIESTELMRWCREALPSYMLPREFVLLDHLPRNATGKIDRPELARRARNERPHQRDG